MECFLVFYANDTGTQLGARHQNVPFKSNVFVILAVPAFPVEFSLYRGAAKDGGILEYVFEGVYLRLLGEKDLSAIANIVLRHWRRHPERNAGSEWPGCAKVIRVACNQGVENSHANPNRLNQRYQTTLVRLPFKGGPQDSRRQPEQRTQGHS